MRLALPAAPDRADRDEASAEAEEREHLAGHVRYSKLLAIVGVAAVAGLAVDENAIDAGCEVHEPGWREQVRHVECEILPAVVNGEAIRIGDAKASRVAGQVIFRHG